MPVTESSSESTITALLSSQRVLPVSSETQLLANSTQSYNIEDYRGRLWQRVLELENEMRIVRGCLNVAVPIGRLPPEVLSNIFLVLKQEHAHKQLPVCFILSHVCQQWRAIAMDCSSLWSDLSDSDGPKLSELKLSRSRNAPLSIQYLQPNGENEKILQLALSQVSRLRDIDIYDSCRSNNAFDLVAAFSGFTGNAPLLRSLRIERETMKAEDQFPDVDLKDIPPSLQILELRNCNIPWTYIPISPSLEYLQLCNEHLNEINRLPTQVFAKLLKCLPRLVSLDLCGYLPADGISTFAHTPVTLPRLSTLKLKDPINHIRSFLRHIQVPHTTDVDVYIRDEIQDAATLNLVLTELKGMDMASSELPAMVPIFKLDLGNDDHIAIANAKFKIEMWFSEVKRDWKRSLTFGVSDMLPTADIVTMLGENFDLSTLEELRIWEYGYQLSRSTWTQLFGHLLKLKTINVDQTTDLQAFFESLATQLPQEAAQDAPAIAPNPRSRLYFPALSAIHLEWVDFGRADEREADVLRVIDTLEKRSLHAQPIKKLRLESCRNFKWSHFERLKDAKIPGLTISWDECEELDSESEYEDDDEADHY
ncbi:hypothetical protein D9611_003183 [Ephemerocybe angulata]|uniref:F-box domain-containing protein n=1 Tax=Ephemerocybe angulata TaxID=980116 RepID=A0A8H5C8G2_9AGAR|nr:hypothetical protein D9611_003183 [Tulosesus angulatus]